MCCYFFQHKVEKFFIYFFKNLGVAGMVFHGVKQTEYYMNFFRLLTMLTELPGAGGPPGTEKKFFNHYNFGQNDDF